jgi:hypothetical protein
MTPLPDPPEGLLWGLPRLRQPGDHVTDPDRPVLVSATNREDDWLIVMPPVDITVTSPLWVAEAARVIRKEKGELLPGDLDQIYGRLIQDTGHRGPKATAYDLNDPIQREQFYKDFPPTP